MAAYTRRLTARGFPAALLLLAWLGAGGASLAQEEEPVEEWPEECSDAAKPFLEKGWFLLHSFEFEWARQEFATASAIDPECAMAFVGEALSFNPPLWEKPQKSDMAFAWSAMQRAQEAGKGSQLDKVFIDYAELLFKHYEKVPRRARNIAFHNAIQRLWRTHGREVEVGAYYGLSILTIDVDSPHPSLDRRREAVAALEPYFKSYPEHPGIALYLLHALDASPELAREGLEAASRVVRLGPDLPHMRHAPARIYVRLGMWHEAVEATLAADRASVELVEALGLPPEKRYIRNGEWMIYALVQTGRIQEAEAFLHEIGELYDETGSTAVRDALLEMRMRFYVDGRQWEDAAKLRPLTKLQREKISVNYMNAMGAAFSGQEGLASRAMARLKAYGPVVLERTLGRAALAFAQGDVNGIREVERIAWIDEEEPPSAFMPLRGMPMRELYGEMLLALGEPAKAVEQFKLALERFERRPGAILGLARAASALGDSTEASARLAEFYEIARDSDDDAPLLVEAGRLPEARVEVAAE